MYPASSAWHAMSCLLQPCVVQVASALAARHIGGAVNYVGVAETLSIGASAQAAGLAADSLICALYFAGLFKLASRIGPDPVSQQAVATDEAAGAAASDGQAGGIQVSAKTRPIPTHLTIHPFTHPFIYTFIYAYMHLLICPFIHTYIHSSGHLCGPPPSPNHPQVS